MKGNAIVCDSAALGAVLYEIEQGVTMLGYVNDVDDMADVDYYAARIQQAADDLRRIINTAKPAQLTGIDKAGTVAQG